MQFYSKSAQKNYSSSVSFYSSMFSLVHQKIKPEILFIHLRGVGRIKIPFHQGQQSHHACLLIKSQYLPHNYLVQKRQLTLRFVENCKFFRNKSVSVCSSTLRWGLVSKLVEIRNLSQQSLNLYFKKSKSFIIKQNKNVISNAC